MELGMRSGSGRVLMKKKSSGCLIVRKKGNNVVGATSSSTSWKLNAFNKRPFSDSGSSDESLMPPSVRVCNGMKRDILEQIRGSGEGLVAENDLDKRGMKRNKLDLFDFNEYGAMDAEKMRRRHFDNDGVGFGGGRSIGSMHVSRSGMGREFKTGSNRYILDKMKNSYYDRTSVLYPGDNVERSRFKMNRDGAPLPPPLLSGKINSDECIRIQGKNGVLKVMVNKKKVGGGPLEHYDHPKRVESRQRLRTEGFADKNVLIHSSSYLEMQPAEKPCSPLRPEKKQIASKKSLSSKDAKGEEWDSDNSNTSLKPGIKSNEVRNSEKKIISEDEQRNTEACKFEKRIISENEQTPMHEKLLTSTIKEGKIRHGSATERQKLRERIREMLLNAGWTIDYRPRRNRDYLDAVYINPAGTAYWSIIKAYEAFQKQLNDDVDESKPKGDGSSFAPIADEVLSQLTRKTRKKMEKELKENNKKKYDTEIESGKEPRIIRSARNKHDMNSMDADRNGEKLSSFVKHGSNSMKNKMIENAIVNASSKSQNATHHSNDGKENSFF